MTRYCVARNTILLRSREQRVFTSACVYMGPINSHCPTRLMSPRSLSACLSLCCHAAAYNGMQFDPQEEMCGTFPKKTLPSGPQAFYEAPTCLNGSAFPVVLGFMSLFFSMTESSWIISRMDGAKRGEKPGDNSSLI